MRASRKVLALIVIGLLPVLSGCLVGAITAGLTGYVLTSKDQTTAYSEISNMPGGRELVPAVDTWLARGQLPLPEGVADGQHNFSVDVGDRLTVPSMRGARIVHLYDNGKLIADYTVVWDGRPPEYRVHEAQSRLYQGKIDVSKVPPLQLQDFYRGI
jgi:hypothetical protein